MIGDDVARLLQPVGGDARQDPTLPGEALIHHDVERRDPVEVTKSRWSLSRR